ncbi:MAG TPA: histidine phosphatase family protein [Acidimicrobiales bacterium]|nr:histidine phosphatase family protein [Acidimicrobiales bacterium]
MSNALVVVRHGETEWSATGRHTSTTDVPLTDTGRTQAQALAPVLAARRFAEVLTSPRRRAVETAGLAGFGDAAVDDDLVEWDYGAYEGRTTADIRVEAPQWNVWDDGAPSGEPAARIAARADRIVARARSAAGDVVVFSHAHFLRVLAARWLGLDVAFGRYLFLDAGSVGELGWEREQPVVRSWNHTPAALL